jgi:hypothetical protein
MSEPRRLTVSPGDLAGARTDLERAMKISQAIPDVGPEAFLRHPCPAACRRPGQHQ